jgi:hypothetical protein
MKARKVHPAVSECAWIAVSRALDFNFASFAQSYMFDGKAASHVNHPIGCCCI